MSLNSSSWLVYPESVFGAAARAARGEMVEVFGNPQAEQQAALRPGALRLFQAAQIAPMDQQDFPAAAAQRQGPSWRDMMGLHRKKIVYDQGSVGEVDVPECKRVECVVIDPLPQSHHLLYGGSREEN